MIDSSLRRDRLERQAANLDTPCVERDARVGPAQSLRVELRVRQHQGRACRSPAGGARAQVRRAQHLRFQIHIQQRPLARRVDRQCAARVALPGSDRQIAELGEIPAALQAAGEAIAAGIDQSDSDQKVQILEIRAGCFECRVDQIEIEGMRQKPFAGDLRAAGTLDEREMIGQLVARAGERIADDLEGRRTAVQPSLPADPKRRLAAGVIVGGDRAVELQMAAFVVEAHVRVVDGYVPHDRKVRGPAVSRPDWSTASWRVPAASRMR